MKSDIDTLYGDMFFKGRHKYHWRAPIVCKAVVHAMKHAHDFVPKSAIDLGCATGDLVQGFLDLGLDAWGIEGSKAALPYLAVNPTYRVQFHDLREPLPKWRKLANLPEFPTRVDVVTCFEVAEHLEEEFADQLVETLCSLSDYLVLSACPPDPNGRKATKYHPNEQPFEYWYQKFAARGYVPDFDVFKFLKVSWYQWRKKYGIAAFWQNLLCVRRDD